MNAPEETATSLAAKLRAAGYLEPTGIQLSCDEAHDTALRRCGMSDGWNERMEKHTTRPKPPLNIETKGEPDCDSVGSMIALAHGLFALVGAVMGSLITLAAQHVLPLLFIWTIGWFTLGLCASEVPPWVLRGIAAVETGVHWADTGKVSGTWKRSTTGDVGPWHVSPAVLKDLNRGNQAERIHRDVVLAESIARLWLLHLYRTTGCWHQSVAAWRLGLGRRHEHIAREYAERAFNYGTAY